MTLFFSCLRRKKQLLPPQRKLDDAMQPSAFMFFILRIIVKYPTMFLTGQVKNPEVMYCAFGIFSQGDYPPNDAIFSCLRCKKIAVTPLEEIGRSIRPSDFVFFNFVCNSETLNDVFGSFFWFKATAARQLLVRGVSLYQSGSEVMYCDGMFLEKRIVQSNIDISNWQIWNIFKRSVKNILTNSKIMLFLK